MSNILMINSKMVDKNDLAQQLASHGLWDLVEDISDDGDGLLQLTEKGEKVWESVENILDNIEYENEKRNKNRK